MSKKIGVVVLTIASIIATTTTSFAGWYQENGYWKYREGSNPPYASTAKQIDGKVYYFDENGYMVTGWKNRNGYWYCYDENGALIRDQWIDGTYYVGNNGRMFVNEYTSDGYFVDSSGKYDPTVDRLNGPGGMISKQPASAYTGAPLDGGASSVSSTTSEVTGTSNGSEKVLVEGNVSAAGRISAPLPDDIMGGFCYAKNSADGVKVHWKATNLTGKTIKYYSVCFAVKNSVGDYCYDQISGQDVKWLYYVGPVAPGKDFIVFDIIGYYGAPHEIIIPMIELEYMDGTKEMVEYLHSTTERHQRIL